MVLWLRSVRRRMWNDGRRRCILRMYNCITMEPGAFCYHRFLHDDTLVERLTRSASGGYRVQVKLEQN